MNSEAAELTPDNKDRYRRRFVLTVTVVLLLIFIVMIKRFLIGIIAGILLWWMTHGLYRRLLIFFKGRKGLAAGISVLATFILFIVPALVIITLLMVDAGNLFARFQEWYAPLQPQVVERLEQLTHGRKADVFGYEIGGPEVARFMERITAQMGQFIVNLISGAASGIMTIVVLILITLYTLYFFYLDGLAFLEWLKRALPLTREQSNSLLKDFFLTSKSTLKSLIIIGLVQGSMGGLAMWIAGIPGPIFWTLVMAVASVIPSIGTQIVLLPAAVLLMLSGKLWTGIALLVWALLVVANIDNILRPIIVRRDVQLHELLVFLSTLGGIILFGFFGFILGPVIVAMLRSILRMYVEIYGQPPEPEPEVVEEKT